MVWGSGYQMLEDAISANSSDSSQHEIQCYILYNLLEALRNLDYLQVLLKDHDAKGVVVRLPGFSSLINSEGGVEIFKTDSGPFCAMYFIDDAGVHPLSEYTEDEDDESEDDEYSIEDEDDIEDEDNFSVGDDVSDAVKAVRNSLNRIYSVMLPNQDNRYYSVIKEKFVSDMLQTITSELLGNPLIDVREFTK